MKKKKTIILIGIVLFLLLFLIGIVVWVGGTKASMEVEKKMVSDYPEEQTITCIKEKGHDDVKETEIVYIQKGVLITRTNISSWNKENPKEQTCEYYTLMTEKLNAKNGISSRVICNEMRGEATTIYTISEVDREDVRLKQFDYLDEKNIFDNIAWVSHMESSGYLCQAS